VEDTGNDETDVYDHTGAQNDTRVSNMRAFVQKLLRYMYMYVQDVYISIILCPLSYPMCSLI